MLRFMNPIKSVYFSFLTWCKYGTTRPRAVTPPGSPSPVYINPHDGRALKKLAHDSARGRVSVPMHFWRDAVSTLNPNLALDVGANYGECFSSITYSAGTQVVAVEANPELIPFLDKTRASHPSAKSIKVINCLVSNEPAAAQTFYYHPDWTGGGSAVRPSNIDGYKQVSVPVESIDRVLNHLGSLESLVFKADVEGYEGMLFHGFSRLFSATRVAGIFEFDTIMMAKAGTPAQGVFELLAGRFQMFDTCRHKRTLRPLKNWAELVAARAPKGGDFHTDLVVLSSQNELPQGWTFTA
jgi:FkbM family methyltransferase